MKELLPFWPQLYVILSAVLIVIRGWWLNGQERKIKLAPYSAIFLFLFYLFVLTRGGFFNHWGIPQVIYVICSVAIFILLIILTIAISSKRFGDSKVDHTISGVRWYDFAGLFLLWWGDFFDSFYQYLNQ